MNFSGLIRRFSTEQSGENKSHPPQPHGGTGTGPAAVGASETTSGGGGGLFSGSSKIFDSVKKTGLVTDLSSKLDQLKRRTSLEAMGIVDKEVEHAPAANVAAQVPPASPSVPHKAMTAPMNPSPYGTAAISSTGYNTYTPTPPGLYSTSSSGIYSSGVAGGTSSSSVSSNTSSSQYKCTPVNQPTYSYTPTSPYSTVNTFSSASSARTQPNASDVSRAEGATSPPSVASSRRDSQTEGQVKRPRPPVPPPPRQASLTSANDPEQSKVTGSTSSRPGIAPSTAYSGAHTQPVSDPGSRTQAPMATSAPSVEPYQSFTNMRPGSTNDQMYGQRQNPFPVMSSNDSWQSRPKESPVAGGDLDSITRMECQKFVSAMGNLMMSTADQEEMRHKETVNRSGGSSSASEYGDEGDRPIYDEDDEGKENSTKSALERCQSSASIESVNEEKAGNEIRDFVRQFVDSIFDSNSHDLEDNKQYFRQNLEHHSCRSWFARQLEQWAMRTHYLSEGTFFRLLEYAVMVMVECEEQEDYVALKDLLEASLRFYCEIKTSAGSSVRLYLYKFYQSLSIWQSLRYWTAAVFEDVQKMRFQVPIGLRDQQSLLTNNSSKTSQKESVEVTVIRNHLNKMMQLSINKDLCLELIRKQGQANNINTSEMQLLRAHVNQHPIY